jgi:hypothetical protein
MILEQEDLTERNDMESDKSSDNIERKPESIKIKKSIEIE